MAAVARGVKGLFPGRTFCVRITDQRTGGLTSLYAEGRLQARARASRWCSSAARWRRRTWRWSGCRADRVKSSTDDVPLIFEGSGARRSARRWSPRASSSASINVEYPEGLSADLVADERMLIQLANQVAVGVRNAKLIDELTFVRKYLEELLEHANALILVANRDRKVVVFNQALADAHRPREGRGAGPGPAQLRPRVRADAGDAGRSPRRLRGEQVTNFETRVLGRDGREVRVVLRHLLGADRRRARSRASSPSART